MAISVFAPATEWIEADVVPLCAYNGCHLWCFALECLVVMFFPELLQSLGECGSDLIQFFVTYRLVLSL